MARFVLLLLLFVAGVLAHQSQLPVLEGNDETLHFNYVDWLRTQHRLPDRSTYTTNSTLQESGQPPLAYWVAAQGLDLLGITEHSGDLMPDLHDVQNPWFTPPNRWNRRDNLNLYYHGENEQGFGHPDVVLGNRVARLLSLFYGMFAVVGAYGAAREVFRREQWVLLATAIFAFTPQMIYTCASVTNDTPAVAFATLAIWQTLRAMRRGATWQRMLLIGFLLALGALSKVSVLLIAPGIGLALVVDCWRRHLSVATLIRNGLLIGLMLALFFGPWVVYGLVTFQDPLGFRTHKTPAFLNIPPPTLGKFLAALPDVYLSYWGKFGTSSVWMNPVVYMLITSLVVLSLFGFTQYLVRKRQPHWWATLPALQGIVLLVIFVLVLAGLLQWLRDLFHIAFAITGRLMFAGHIATAIGFAGGLALLSHRWQQATQQMLRLAALTLFAGTGLLAAPISIHTAYALPTLLQTDNLPVLTGGSVDFDHTIRLLGVTQPTNIVRHDALHQMTLCWQSLRPTTRTAAFAIKLFSQQNQIVGERTSIHGMGLFPTSLWKPGDIFCDNVDIPTYAFPAAGQTYNVLVIVLDSHTMAADWPATHPPDDQPVQYPFVAQVVGE